MNWPNKKLCRHFAFWLGVLFTVGCGVKGDPLPPEKPVELGRGRPTYKRATEGLKIEKNKNAPAKEQKDDEDDEE